MAIDSVDVLGARMRRKVDEIGGTYTYIQTQHGVGYRFEATPRQMPQAARAARCSARAPLGLRMPSGSRRSRAELRGAGSGALAQPLRFGSALSLRRVLFSI